MHKFDHKYQYLKLLKTFCHVKNKKENSEPIVAGDGPVYYANLKEDQLHDFVTTVAAIDTNCNTNQLQNSFYVLPIASKIAH